MEKGFTLVELLAVIIILGVLMLIAIPVVNNIINESKEKSYLEQEERILEIAYQYSLNNDLGYDNDVLKIITFEQLINKGLLSEIPVDPRTGEEIAGCVNYTWNENFNRYDFKLSNECSFSITPGTDSVLNGAKPVLTDGLIPVIIEGNINSNKIVKKADPSSTWYNYEESIWANAILVTDETRNMYETAEVGTVIEQEDILVYYVWIPRFEVLNTESAEKYDIKFVNKDAVKSDSTVIGEYDTPEVFTNNGTELNGIWYTKYSMVVGNGNKLYKVINDVSDNNIIKFTDNIDTLISNTLENSFDNKISNMPANGNPYGLNSSVITLNANNIDILKYISKSAYGLKGSSTVYDANSLSGNVSGIYDKLEYPLEEVIYIEESKDDIKFLTNSVNEPFLDTNPPILNLSGANISVSFDDNIIQTSFSIDADYDLDFITINGNDIINNNNIYTGLIEVEKNSLNISNINITETDSGNYIVTLDAIVDEKLYRTINKNILENNSTFLNYSVDILATDTSGNTSIGSNFKVKLDYYNFLRQFSIMIVE